MPLLSDIRFGSYLVYSPSGQSAKSQKSAIICRAVKNDSTIPLESQGGRLARVIPHVVEHLANHLEQSELRDLFRPPPLLIPAPRSALMKPGTVWPAKLICDELRARGLGAEVQELLLRKSAVPKAALQLPANRPTTSQHFASLEAISLVYSPTSILLVDDVVTSGTMLLASVSRLKEAHPQSTVAAFALVRTMSGAEIDNFSTPCVGSIHLINDRGRRRP